MRPAVRGWAPNVHDHLQWSEFQAMGARRRTADLAVRRALSMPDIDGGTYVIAALVVVVIIALIINSRL